MSLTLVERETNHFPLSPTMQNVGNKRPTMVTNTWEISYRTPRFGGHFDTTTKRNSITIPSHLKAEIDEYVKRAISKAMACKEINETDYEGTQALEIATNIIIKNSIDHPKIRVELFPGSIGLTVVINIQYYPDKISELLTIGDNNEDKIRGGTSRPYRIRTSS